MKIVVSEFIDEAALAGFNGVAEVVYGPELVDDRSALLAACADADALIVRNRTQVDRAVLDAAPQLRAVGRLGVGLDNIDIEACAERGVTVRPASGANTLSVVEYVISTALTLTRGAYTSNEAMIAGEWPRSALIGGEISGLVMGLIGYGEIARAVAERATALGMKIAAYDPFLPEDHPHWATAERCSLAEVLTKADVLSLHVPLTDETRNLIDSNALMQMKETAILINTARGGVVNETALAEALLEGRLGGAALDVFEAEPLTVEAAAKFAGIANLILTPHIAGVTQPGNIRVSAVTVANVIEELTKR